MSYAEDFLMVDTFDGDDIPYEYWASYTNKEGVEFVGKLPVWITNEGKYLYIKDMTTSHIKNCIKLIYKKNGTWRNGYLKYLKEELIKRKYDMALTTTQYKEIAKELSKYSISCIFTNFENIPRRTFHKEIAGVKLYISIDTEYAVIPSISKEECAVLEEILMLLSDEEIQNL